MLKVLYQNYTETGDLQMEITTFLDRSHIPESGFSSALTINVQKRLMEDIRFGSANRRYLVLTAEGIEHCHLEKRPRRRKVWDSLKPHIWKVIIGTIVVVIGGLILHILT